MARYLRLPNYTNNLLRCGFTQSDIDNVTDRLVDRIVASGDLEATVGRVREHFDAGADHVCIQPFRTDGIPGPDLETLERLAPAKA